MVFLCKDPRRGGSWRKHLYHHLEREREIKKGRKKERERERESYREERERESYREGRGMGVRTGHLRRWLLFSFCASVSLHFEERTAPKHAATGKKISIKILLNYRFSHLTSFRKFRIEINWACLRRVQILLNIFWSMEGPIYEKWYLRTKKNRNLWKVVPYENCRFTRVRLPRLV